MDLSKFADALISAYTEHISRKRAIEDEIDNRVDKLHELTLKVFQNVEIQPFTVTVDDHEWTFSVTGFIGPLPNLDEMEDIEKQVAEKFQSLTEHYNTL